MLLLTALLVVACSPAKSLQNSGESVSSTTGSGSVAENTADLDPGLEELNDLDTLDTGLDDINFNDLENLDLQ